MTAQSEADSNRRIVLEAYEGLAAGDIRALLDRLAPDVEWHEARGLRLTGGDHRGRDAVANEVLAPFTGAIRNLAVLPDRSLTEADVVVVLGRYTGVAAGTGAAVDVPFVHVWELENGAARRFTQHTDTALLNEALAATSA